MDQDKLIGQLNWFYSLEQSQVELYSTQAKRVKDNYLSRALDRFAVIEQQHVDNLAEFIKNLGGKPTSLGDVVAPLVGKTLGSLLGLTNHKLMLQTNIVLESKAMEDYKKLLGQIGDQGNLTMTLWSNLIDEDLHTRWMDNWLNKLELLS